MTVAMATERSKKSAFLDIFLQYLFTIQFPSVNFLKICTIKTTDLILRIIEFREILSIRFFLKLKNTVF